MGSPGRHRRPGRFYVISRLPRLTHLDDEEVTEEEREAALKVYQARRMTVVRRSQCECLADTQTCKSDTAQTLSLHAERLTSFIPLPLPPPPSYTLFSNRTCFSSQGNQRREPRRKPTHDG